MYVYLLAIILAINVLTVCLLFNKRHYELTLLFSLFVALHSVQAILMLPQLVSSSGSILYLYNEVTLEGFEESLLYLFILSGAALLSGFVLPARSSFSQSPLFLSSRSDKYRLLFLHLLFVISLLWFIQSVGGVSAFLYSSRPAAADGSTLPLVLMSVGIFPLLYLRLLRKKASILSIASYSLSMGVALVTSKMHFLAYLLSTMIVILPAFNPLAGSELRESLLSITPQLTPSKSIRHFKFSGRLKAFLLSIVLVPLLFYAGYFRDSLSDLDPTAHTEVTLLGTASDRVNTFSDISVFYNLAVEGQSSIAGAFTLSRKVNASSDLGLTILVKSLYQVFPASLKHNLGSLVDVNEFYWYQSAIVPSSACDMYIAYGWFGALLFPVFLFGLYRFFLLLYSRSASAAFRVSVAVQLGLLVFLVRGSLFVYLAFAIAYLFVSFIPLLVLKARV